MNFQQTSLLYHVDPTSGLLQTATTNLQLQQLNG